MNVRRVRVFYILALCALVENASAQEKKMMENDSMVTIAKPKDDTLASPMQLLSAKPEIEPFPILSYDTDVGFGYGAKGFFLNQIGWNESFDVVLFNSTKGERWYRVVVSIPDFELRQGKKYSSAFDIVIDYDKYLYNSFFGIGNGSKLNDREKYTREPLELNLIISRGITKDQVGQLGIKFKAVCNFILSNPSKLAVSLPPINSGRASMVSMFFNYRYDTRNSYINPSHGSVLFGEIEYAPEISFTNVSLLRYAVWVQHYREIFSQKIILAVRAGIQTLVGDDIPVQMLLPIGGTSTLRGYPQDRFLDKTSIVMNTEIRFPIFWRFGGVAGLDAGKIWNGLDKIDFTRWAWNPVAGLRFYMDTFVVRLDVGVGSETVGFYLNFGHLF
jgi:outer membrane protein assembly factor BamA